ncbi:sialidase family protein [Dactylosporangium sp. NPDC051485]|uniref:sialidase family protein n=1 Tax=Dactylosporangium sp. NPDC051485 TaxID=3154846 RepID=UPI003446CB4C
MPDRMETRLRAERDRLDGIEQPPLAVIAARAAALRRRRRAAAAGVAALAALAIAGTALTAKRAGDSPPPVVAASAAGPGQTWSAEGITIDGLPEAPRDLPGSIRAAEFLDADRGFLLTADCCRAWVSATTDGGRTFRTLPSPIAGVPTLVAGPGGVTIVGPAPAYQRASTVDGEHWGAPVATPPGPPAAPSGTARLLPLGDGCGATTAAVDGDTLAPVPAQPPITACWWSPVRAGDGAWWVGGRDADGRPALAVSRDAGATWAVHAFPGLPANAYARAATLGRTVFVTVVSPPDATAGTDHLLAVAQSVDGGATFGPVHPTAGQATIGGDAVLLLDGRVLIVDGYGHWLVSENGGASWHRLEGLHPTLRIARTQAGYVAYQMFSVYTAFSVDGSTWQKINAQ